MKAGSSHGGGAEAELEVLLLLCTTAATLLCGQKRREKKTQDSEVHKQKESIFGTRENRNKSILEYLLDKAYKSADGL